MAPEKQYPEWRMLTEINAIIKNKRVPVPKSKNVNIALSAAHRRDPTAFGSAASRERIIKDIADDFVERYKKRQQIKTDRYSTKGEPIPYLAGFEFAILAVSKLRPYIESLRESIWGSKQAPFRSFQDAAAWVDDTHTADAKTHEGAHTKMTVTLELTIKGRIAELVSDDDLLWPFGVSLEYMKRFHNDELSIVSWLERAGTILQGATIEGARSRIDSEYILLLGPPHEPRTIIADDTRTKKWTLIQGGVLKSLFDECKSLANEHAPSWDEQSVFGHLLYGDYKILPTQIEPTYVKGKLTGGVTMRLPYPTYSIKVKKSYEQALEFFNSPEIRHRNLNATTLSEHQLNLLNLVYVMPIENFTWSQRLAHYLDTYREDISMGFMPDYGLAQGQDDIPTEKWHNAARNIGRDYKNVLKKLL